MKSVFVFIVILLCFPASVFAHPGRTASDGCHYCRTNCDKWGVAWNERHCHGGGIPVQEVETPVYVAPTRVIVLPTRTPTRIPTRTITRTPTRTPSRIPTRVPTRIPTIKPTTTPTTTPTTILTATLTPTEEVTPSAEIIEVKSEFVSVVKVDTNQKGSFSRLFNWLFGKK